MATQGQIEPGATSIQTQPANKMMYEISQKMNHQTKKDTSSISAHFMRYRPFYIAIGIIAVITVAVTCIVLATKNANKPTNTSKTPSLPTGTPPPPGIAPLTTTLVDVSLTWPDRNYSINWEYLDQTLSGPPGTTGKNWEWIRFDSVCGSLLETAYLSKNNQNVLITLPDGSGRTVTVQIEWSNFHGHFVQPKMRFYYNFVEHFVRRDQTPEPDQNYRDWNQSGILEEVTTSFVAEVKAEAWRVNKNIAMCSICWDEIEDELADPTDAQYNSTRKIVRMRDCPTVNTTHLYHHNCALRTLRKNLGCPLCKQLYGIEYGSQTAAQMYWYINPTMKLNGTGVTGSIMMTWAIKDGYDYEIQDFFNASIIHNQRYCYGDYRRAMYPNDYNGRLLLVLLKHACRYRRVFKLDYSGHPLRQGVYGTVYNIHLKTSPDGEHGYPDPTFLHRVAWELDGRKINTKLFTKEDKDVVTAKTPVGMGYMYC